jgi:hypothetical protein
MFRQTFVRQVMPVLYFGLVGSLVEKWIERVDDLHVDIEEIHDDRLAREGEYLPW